MYFSDFNQGMMKKPAIHSFWSRDVYISPVGHALDPLDDRIQTHVHLQQGTPVTSDGMTLTLLDVEARTPDADAASTNGAHPTKEVVATIDVVRGGVHQTLKPVLQGLSDGNTNVVPADIANTDQAISLLATETTGTEVEVGIRWPALGLMRGESGDIQGNKVSLNDYEVVMPAREGGSVKVFANAHVEMGGETFHLKPGIISRPGESGGLEQIEAPIGRTGQNLILDKVEANTGRAFFHIAQAPQEYLYAEVSLKPFIGLLWVGTALTVLGLAFATFQRGRLANRLVAAESGAAGLEAKKNGKRVAA
jgi:hypothetical protein